MYLTTVVITCIKHCVKNLVGKSFIVQQVTHDLSNIIMINLWPELSIC